jgi:hypothetical protein
MQIAKSSTDPAEREKALNMAVRMGEPDAARNALLLTGGVATLPLTKAAAIRSTYGLVGSSVGGELGSWMGHGLEKAGLPAGTSKVGGIVGGLAGGGVGLVKGPQALETVAELMPGSRMARLLQFLSGATKSGVRTGAKTAEKAAATTAAKAVLSEEEQLTRDIMRGVNGVPVERQKAQQMARDILSGGKSAAPAATKTASQIAKEADSALRVDRIQRGAEKAGMPVGMTKEAVRKEVGPVLDEALGEASPILPKKALQRIIDDMKALPPAQREAYVARASSGKTRWQAENLRRTLEHLGLLLPAAAVGAATYEAQ